MSFLFLNCTNNRSHLSVPRPYLSWNDLKKRIIHIIKFLKCLEIHINQSINAREGLNETFFDIFCLHLLYNKKYEKNNISQFCYMCVFIMVLAPATCLCLMHKFCK